MIITANKPGDRVELIKCKDEYTHIPPGEKGTVDLIDSAGTVHVTWDNGYHLGLVPGVDQWETLVHRPEPGEAIVTKGELGVNCWHPRRFVGEGTRCDRIYQCNYPEKHRCEAILAEIRYLKDKQLALVKESGDIDCEIENLIKMRIK